MAAARAAATALALSLLAITTGSSMSDEKVQFRVPNSSTPTVASAGTGTAAFGARNSMISPLRGFTIESSVSLIAAAAAAAAAGAPSHSASLPAASATYALHRASPTAAPLPTPSTPLESDDTPLDAPLEDVFCHATAACPGPSLASLRASASSRALRDAMAQRRSGMTSAKSSRVRAPTAAARARVWASWTATAARAREQAGAPLHLMCPHAVRGTRNGGRAGTGGGERGVDKAA